MTPNEVAVLLTYASAVDPRVRRVDAEQRRLQVTAWHAQLADCDPGDAQAAVDRHYAAADPEALLPGRVRSLIAGIRAERLAARPEAEPDADPDDWRAYRAALRAGRARIGSGVEPSRPVKALIGRAFRKIGEDA